MGAGRSDVQARIVDLGRDCHQTEDGMEQVVMGQCQSGLAVETCCIEPTACLERFGEPPHHGYTGLFVGGNGLRQPVQEESFFTQDSP